MIGKSTLTKVLWKGFSKLQEREQDRLYYQSIARFRKKMMDPTFEWEQYNDRINPYFKKFDFRFSTLESEYYAECTGIKSDLYLPIALYENIIYPYLNPDPWRVGYCDKNMFPRLLNINEAQKLVDVQIPECITYCDNGRFYLPKDVPCTRKEAIDAVLSCNTNFIIKPTIDSWHGRGVRKVNNEEFCVQFLNDLFDQYGKNFTIQKVIRQHPMLAAFNPTSVNTIRITTYLDFNGEVKVLYASQRFGGEGKVYDNADDPNGSGGFCQIMKDGTVCREIHRYRNLKTSHLKSNVPEQIPCYDKVVEVVKFMHTRFPQFGLIGWDMTVTEDEHPLLIEYNFFPGLGTGQLAHGPMFEKEDLDEIMERIANHKFRYLPKAEISFPDRKTNTILRRV